MQKTPRHCFCTEAGGGRGEKRGLLPFVCAGALGIKPVDDIMKQFGISDQDLEAMEERFAGMRENGDMDPAAMMRSLG